MRKYGVHWGLFLPGYLILAVTLLFWLSQMFDAIQSPDTTNSGIWVGQVFLHAFLIFSTARENAKQKEKAAQATENKPFKGEVVTDPNNTQAATPLSIRLRKGFGIVSTFVSVVTVGVYLLGGKLTVPSVIAYCFGVPLCAVMGGYLMLKARELESVNRERTSQRRAARAQASPASVVTTAVEEDKVLVATLGR